MRRLLNTYFITHFPFLKRDDIYYHATDRDGGSETKIGIELGNLIEYSFSTPFKAGALSEENECDNLVQNQARLIDQYKRTIDQYEVLITKINTIPSAQVARQEQIPSPFTIKNGNINLREIYPDCQYQMVILIIRWNISLPTRLAEMAI